MSLERFIKFIKEGEPVAPGTPNRPLRQLDQNIQYLRDIIDAAHLGSTVYAREVTVESVAEVGMPVYWNINTGSFDRAIAKTETDPFTGFVRSAPSSEVWGIIAEKHAANNADLLLFGYADIDISAATDSSGVVPVGTYYLSGTNPGKLLIQRPSVTVAVVRSDGGGKVFVNPSFVDFLDNHQHYKFDLDMLPAGDTSPPFIGVGTGGDVPERSASDAPPGINNPDIHVITNADTSLPGWLPADNAIFDSNAPAGAKFGYNLSADTKLDNMFPPVPVESVDVELLRSSIYQNMGSFQQDISDAFGTSPATTLAELNQLTVEFLCPGLENGDSVLVNAIGIGTAAPPVGLAFRAYMYPAGTAGEASKVCVTVNNTTDSSIVIAEAGIPLRVTVFKGPKNWKLMKLSGQVLDDLVQVDRHGIWWMSNCYDQVPWPTDLDTDASASESDTGYDCPRAAVPQMRLYFTKVNFATDNSVVSSLTSVDNRIKIYCAGSTTVDSVGDLDIDLDFDFTTTENTSGYQVLKSFTETTEGQGVFTRGPIAEGIYTTTPNKVLLAGDINSENAGPNNETIYRGNVKVDLTTTPTQELASQLVRLNGVTEEHDPLLYLGMTNEYATSYIVKFDIPADAPTVSFFAYRMRIIGRAAGTLPQLTFTWQRTVRPTVTVTGKTFSEPVTAIRTGTPWSGTIDTTTVFSSPSQTGTMPTVGALDNANEIIETTDLWLTEMAGDNGVGFPVEPGDVVYITVTRTKIGDSYTAELGIVQQTGLLNLPLSYAPSAWTPQ